MEVNGYNFGFAILEKKQNNIWSPSKITIC